MTIVKNKNSYWWFIVAFLIISISTLHYMTPTSQGHFHLFYMQAYFIPILIAAFQFGIRGGLGVAIAVSVVYIPHLMLQWVGSTEHTLLGTLQIIMFNIIGFLTGFKAQKESQEKTLYQQTSKKLKQSIGMLERQSEELSELEEQLRQLDRLAVVGELTASLAHEVRTPLGSIRGTVEILRDNSVSEKKKAEFFQILMKETERMSSVVENYLSFARKQKPRHIQYDVRQVIENTTAMLASRGRKENIRFQVQLPRGDLIYNGDPNHLHQILMNLLLNAIEASSRGGEILIAGKICVNNHDPDGSTENFKPNSMLKLTMRDQGIGIKPEEIDKIFLPFYTSRPNGTGLGLSIVKRIIDENHWHINITSQPGQGTEITLEMSNYEANSVNR